MHGTTGNLEDVLVEIFQEKGGRSSCIYKNEIGDWLCEVMLLLNPRKEQAVLLAIMFDEFQVEEIIESVNEGRSVVSALESSTGKQIVKIEHGQPEKLLPGTDFEDYS